MTKDEFLTKLKQTPRDWYVMASGEIRRGPRTRQDCLCPMHALSPEMYSGRSAGAHLGLVMNDIDDIVAAADFPMRHLELKRYPKRIRMLRAQLQDACGLNSEAT